MQPTCKAGGPRASKGHAINVLLADATRYKPVFDALLDALFAEATSAHGGVRAEAVRVVKAANKGATRCHAKVTGKYACAGQYGARQLSDIVRGSLEFTDEASICRFVEGSLRSTHGQPKGKLTHLTVRAVGTDPKTGRAYTEATVEITNSKNRFRDNAAGMRDMLVNVRMKLNGDPFGHVGELQLHHTAMLAAKHDFHCICTFGCKNPLEGDRRKGKRD